MKTYSKRLDEYCDVRPSHSLPYLTLCFVFKVRQGLNLDVPLLLYVWIVHLKLFPHGALYFCRQGVLEKD